MIKNIITSIFLLQALLAIAQNETPGSFKSKNGHVVLPEAGNWSFGVSASPFLQYAGNFLSGATSTNTAPNVFHAGAASILGGNLSLGNGILGKYMLTNNTAIRVRFNAAFYNETRREWVTENSIISNPLTPSFVEDKYTRTINNYSLAAGLEKRRGNQRLQGIYGGEIFLGFLKETRQFEYGNEISSDFASPASFNFIGNVNNLSGVAFSRTTAQDLGSQFYAGARGYVGVEYFVAPKISIGAELGYSIGFLTNGNASRTDETLDPVSLKPVEVETKLKRNSNLNGFGFGLDNMNSSLNLFFYF